MSLINQGYFYNYRKRLFSRDWEYSLITIDTNGYLSNGRKAVDLAASRVYYGAATYNLSGFPSMLDSNIDVGLLVCIETNKALCGTSSMWILFPDYNSLLYIT